MRATAARLVEPGAPLVLAEVELPEPGPDQCIVEMAFGGLNPVDRYEALGRVRQDAPLPRTLGSEGAGLARSAAGERRVFLNRAALVRESDGLWSSHVLAQADKLLDVPQGVGLAEAAAVGVVGVTAWRCVSELAEVTEADRVLVLGASGGVGSAIVSLAHGLGAVVVGQTGSPGKESFVSERGADRVVTAGAAELATALGEFTPTVVFDPLGDGFTGVAVELLAPRGRLVLFGTSADATGSLPLQALYRKYLRVLGYSGLIEPEGRLRQAAGRALEALAEKRMEIVVGKRRPLVEVNEALEDLAERRVLGKLVLDLAAG